jgi:hypothetical protein
MTKSRFEKENNIKLFEIGTEVSCDCPETCSNSGKITGYDFDGSMYNLETGSAYFDFAKKLTKLDKVLK